MNHIKQLRKRAGYRTAQDGAEALEISISMMKKLDCGVKIPSIYLALKITKVFNCTLDEIFLPYFITQSEVS